VVIHSYYTHHVLRRPQNCAGIAKGIRRVVALTRGEAQQAIAEGQRLEGLVAAAAQQTDMGELDKALSACRQVGVVVNVCNCVCVCVCVSACFCVPQSTAMM